MSNKCKDPAFLFYSSDFLTGCAGLTMEERGQYITLICLQHQQGHLSKKTIRLSVGNLSEDVKNKFKIDSDGLFYNLRVDEEKEKRRKFADSRRNNGKKGGRPKKPLGYPSAKPLGYPRKNLHENENINENININENEFIIPSVEEIINYVNENNFNVNAEVFHSFYSSKGWRIGKNIMTDWKAAIKTWEINENID